MSQDVTITLSLTLPAEAVEGFRQMGSKGLEATKTFPGCKDVRIVQHKDDPCRFLFVELWESEEAYNAYVAWRTERGEFTALQSIATRIETDVWPTIVATT